MTGAVALGAPWVLAGCAAPVDGRTGHRASADAADLALLNRITWGIDSAAVDALRRSTRSDYIGAQLEPGAQAVLPATVQAQIDALTLHQKPMTAWVLEMDQR
ncbi:MAG: DUF1800 domain-containing protein, partial [Rhizobacter sp.]|nr:DUF1800 domain-containing protein [Rhizobacter sp.]